MKLIRFGRYVVLMLLVVGVSHGLAFSDSVVWVRSPDFSLWRETIPPSGDAVLLYGHGVGPSFLTPSPDGSHVAADSVPVGESIGLYDTQRPGVRQTLHIKPLGQELFVGAWSRDGSGVLVSRCGADQEGLHEGIYVLKPDGHRKLVAASAAKDITCAGDARYSPNGGYLAIQGDVWLQIVRFPESKTVMFLTGLERGLPAPTWVDDQHLVISGMKGLQLVDIPKKEVRSMFKDDRFLAMAYSKSRGRLYAVKEGALYSINMAAGEIDQVALGGLQEVAKICGVTRDGKTAIILARDPERVPSHSKSGFYRSLWAVNLDTGRHTLISDDSSVAALLPPPSDRPKQTQ